MNAFRVILEPAGAFAPWLSTLAVLTFGLTAWCALAVTPRTATQRDAYRVRRALPVLAALCSTGPLLGLLGTVHGLMRTFRSFEETPSLVGTELADGVKQALFTSEFGLCIAIPGLLAHAALRRVMARKLAGAA